MTAFLKHSAVGFALIALIAAVPRATSGFERLCKPIEFCVWDAADMPIPYTIDLVSLAAYPVVRPGQIVPGFDPIEVIHRAFRAWEEVPGTYVRFRYEPNVNFDPDNPWPLIQVYFTDDSGAWAYLLKHRPRGTMAMLYARVRVGTNHGAVGRSKEVFYKDVKHEIGHVLGLGHPSNPDQFRDPNQFPGIGGPVMGHGGVPSGVEWFPFHPDDIAGIRFLYPALRGSGQQLRISGPPEVEIWPAFGSVSYQGQDFQIAISDPDGRDDTASVQVLANGQDVTAGVGWLFGMFGRLTPHGYVLSLSPNSQFNAGALLRAGMRCGTLLEPECKLFPPRSLGPTITITVTARDTSGNETRVERTYTIVP
ncbi:hypothetical protein HYW67_00170 [Candidatus Parcubacteria bacterium]|nr:hypothetical protein [Candidatus Parcubacteria bacterium]